MLKLSRIVDIRCRLGCKAYSTGFDVEGFISRIDALTKDSAASKNQRWKVSVPKREPRSASSTSKTRASSDKARGAPPHHHRPDHQKQTSVNGQISNRNAGSSDSFATRGSLRVEPHGVARRLPSQLSGTRSSSPAGNTLAASAKRLAQEENSPKFGSLRSLELSTTQNLTRSTKPRTRTAGKSSRQSRQTTRRVAQQRQQSELPRFRDTGSSGFISGTQALQCILRNVGTERNGYIHVDQLTPETLAANLVPSAVTYNTRVWSLVNAQNVEKTSLDTLYSHNVSGRVEDGDRLPNLNGPLTDPAQVAISNNSTLSPSDKLLMSRIVAGEIRPSQLKAQLFSH